MVTCCAFLLPCNYWDWGGNLMTMYETIHTYTHTRTHGDNRKLTGGRGSRGRSESSVNKWLFDHKQIIVPRRRRAEGCYLRWHGPLSRADVPPGEQSICYPKYGFMLLCGHFFWGLIHPHAPFFFFFSLLLSFFFCRDQHPAAKFVFTNSTSSPESRSFLCGFSEPFTDSSDSEVIVVISNGCTAISCVFSEVAKRLSVALLHPLMMLSAGKDLQMHVCGRLRASELVRSWRGGWEDGSDWGERRAAVVFLWMERWKAPAQSCGHSVCLLFILFCLTCRTPGCGGGWRWWWWGSRAGRARGLAGQTEKKHQRMRCKPLSDVEETH